MEEDPSVRENTSCKRKYETKCWEYCWPQKKKRRTAVVQDPDTIAHQILFASHRVQVNKGPGSGLAAWRVHRRGHGMQCHATEKDAVEQ